MTNVVPAATVSSSSNHYPLYIPRDVVCDPNDPNQQFLICVNGDCQDGYTLSSATTLIMGTTVMAVETTITSAANVITTTVTRTEDMDMYAPTARFTFMATASPTATAIASTDFATYCNMDPVAFVGASTGNCLQVVNGTSTFGDCPSRKNLDSPPVSGSSDPWLVPHFAAAVDNSITASSDLTELAFYQDLAEYTNTGSGSNGLSNPLICKCIKMYTLINSVLILFLVEVDQNTPTTLTPNYAFTRSISYQNNGYYMHYYTVTVSGV